MTKEQSFHYYHDRELKELFDVKEPKIAMPAEAKIFESYRCESCGEITAANWIRIMDGKKVCLDCYETYDRFSV